MRGPRGAAVAALLAFACAHEYREPDPSAVPTARVVIENPSADSLQMSTTAAVVHVYEANPDCERTYLGTVSIADPEREIVLAADHRVLLELSLFEERFTGTGSCQVAVAFVPRAGTPYRLIVGDRFRYRCTLELKSENGGPIGAFDPRDCRAD